jgi:hypothetical protein
LCRECANAIRQFATWEYTLCAAHRRDGGYVGTKADYQFCDIVRAYKRKGGTCAEYEYRPDAPSRWMRFKMWIMRAK